MPCIHPNRLTHCSLLDFSVKRYVASQSILSLLRERGPTPISKISSELSDGDLEEISESGVSIIELLKRKSDVVVLTIMKSLHIAFLKDMIQHVELHHKQKVSFLLASVAALHHFPRMFSTHLSLPAINTDALLRIAMKEGTASLFDSTDTVHRILHRYPSLFKVERGGQVRLALPSVSTPPGKDILPEIPPVLSSSFACQMTVKQNMLLSALKKNLSESIYMQLTTWLASTSAFWRSLPLEDLLGRLDQLQRNDPPLIDVRKFGSRMESIFIRVLGRQADGMTLEDEKKKNVLDVQQKLFGLGNQAAKELQDFISRGRENYLSMLQGLSMDKISEILSPELRSRAFQLFFSDSNPGTDGHPNSSLILLFDRFRHIFDVNFSSGTVRLWSALPPSEQPSTLTWESSPLPLLLRHLLTSLQTHPRSPQELFDSLPPLLQWQLNQTYGQGIKMEGEMKPKVGKIGGDSKEQISLFVSHHSMFMFLAQDGLVYTPQLVISQKQKKCLNLSDNEKAIALFNSLPPSGAVDLMTFLGSDAGRQLPFSTRNISESFVLRFPSFFKLYSPFASHRTVVGRVGVPPPPANFLNPNFESPADIIKFIALHAVGGVTESAIVNNLSKEGRAWLKRIGTPTDIAEQLPMWFDVRRDKFNCGASLITYIPGSRDNVNPSSRPPFPTLQLITNDRKCQSEIKEKGDEWNEEWDEEPEEYAAATHPR